MELCIKIACAFLFNSLTHCFFLIYRTSAASSDEIELWSSLDNNSQLQTLNFFSHRILSYLIGYSSGKAKSNASSLCHLELIVNTNKYKKIKIRTQIRNSDTNKD